MTAAHPHRRQALAAAAIHPVLLPLALVSAAGLARYAVAEAALQSTGDAHAAAAHYFDQAWFAVAVLLLLVSAVRDDLRRFAGRLGGVALAAFGLVGLAFPTAVSSPGAVQGAVALLVGVATVVLAARPTQADVAA